MVLPDLSSKSSLKISGEAKEARLVHQFSVLHHSSLTNSWLETLCLENPETFFGLSLYLRSTYTKNAILINVPCSTDKAEDPERKNIRGL